ncbi:hypothetical protein AVEN_35919-1 [Araneus ventricosus]|uniref:Uncharacterized protein n=1 Tax=Araneus ventricosus TaxID=182803 RepID=A0A4Y2R1N4_ARAVE|nr:hypothetical protein AVEN_35919-1 [Araneus ventricosus]
MERPLQTKWRDSTPYRSNFSLDIHGETAPIQMAWQHSTSFQFSAHPFRRVTRLGYMHRSLRSPRVTASIPPPAFKTESLPHWSKFSDFHFSVRAFSPSPRSHFSFMTQRSKCKTNEDENPNFSTAST